MGRQTVQTVRGTSKADVAGSGGVDGGRVGASGTGHQAAGAQDEGGVGAAGALGGRLEAVLTITITWVAGVGRQVVVVAIPAPQLTSACYRVEREPPVALHALGGRHTRLARERAELAFRGGGGG